MTLFPRGEKNKISAVKIAVLGILTTLGLLSFLLESLLPPLFFPGAKLGLANLFSLLALLLYSPVEAFFVLIARAVLGAVFVGNLSALLYSFTAGLASLLLSSVLWRFFREQLSITAVSVCSAVVHNLAQLFIYLWLTGSVNLVFYAPYLMLCGILSGAVVGGLTVALLRFLPLERWRNKEELSVKKNNKNNES